MIHRFSRFLTLSALFLLAFPEEALAKFTTVSYDRNAGALLDALPQGKPFLIEGTIFPSERRVEVFYRRRGDKDCTAGPPRTATCPSGEKSGDWACRAWERTAPGSGKAEKYTVLIPRLLHSLEAYCVRVAFYRTLSLERSTAMADNLVLSLDRALQERAGPSQRRLDPKQRRRAIDEFFAEEALSRRVTPTEERGMTLKQANLAKLKTDLDLRLGTLHVARTMLGRLRQRFDAAVKALLAPGIVQATNNYLASLERSSDPQVQKLRGQMVAKPKGTLLQAVQTHRDHLARLRTAGELEAQLRSDDGAFLHTRLLSQLCNGIAAARATTPALDVKGCGPELRQLPQAVERTWRGLRAAAKNKGRVYAGIVDAVRQHLTDRIFTETAMQDPALVSRSKFIEYFFSTDIGVAAAFVPAASGTETVAIPYLAVHFYLGPYNNNVPLRLEDSFLRRFTLFFGLNLKGFEIRSDQLAADGLFGNMVMMTGAGLRLTDFIRLNGGVMLYRYRDQNVLFQDQLGKLSATGFISVSLVLDVYKWAATALRQ